MEEETRGCDDDPQRATPCGEARRVELVKVPDAQNDGGDGKGKRRATGSVVEHLPCLTELGSMLGAREAVRARGEGR